MGPGDDGAGQSGNRLNPLRFVLSFGVVSMLADLVYEGARSIVGPYLASFGASAALVGAVTGLGEAVALGFRLVTGRLSDRTRRYWPITFVGYLITVVSVPLLGAVTNLYQAMTAVVAERFAKAVRTPARDTMLGHASAELGRGRTFALHEALDQSGALLGPLLVAAMVAVSGFRLGFAVLVLPGVGALVMLSWLWRAAPHPERYDPAATRAMEQPVTPEPWWRFSQRYWTYSAFAAMTMVGFSTFGVLSYHMAVAHVMAAWEIPIVYAAAMGADALAALASGWLYDRVGLRGLVILPPLTATLPFLTFSDRAVWVWAGAVLWGFALGIHESTLRAAVTDLVPVGRRGAGYGTFTAVYGLAWLAGGWVIGLLYEVSHASVDLYVALTQLAALGIYVVLIRSSSRPPTALVEGSR